MPLYIYGCDNKEHPRKEVVHGMNENPDIRCDVCGGKMHRIPSGGRFYINPESIIVDYLDENYRRYRARKKGRHVDKFSPERINRPGGLPQREYHTRK